jgi:hypothetical protein
MNIVDNITDSLKYPLNDWVKILILTVISIIPIVNFMSGGYYLRIIKSTLAGVDEVPEFDDLGELFIDGIKIIIVGIVYMIVPLIIYAIAWLPLLFTGDPYSVTSGIMSGLTIVLMIIAFVVTFIVSLLLLPAIVNMALYDSELGAAFRFSEVLGRIKAIGWGDYILWIIAIWITTVIAGFIIGIIGAILLIILIGFLVWFLGGAYLSMFQARSLALLFGESIE